MNVGALGAPFRRAAETVWPPLRSVLYPLLWRCAVGRRWWMALRTRTRVLSYLGVGVVLPFLLMWASRDSDAWWGQAAGPVAAGGWTAVLGATMLRRLPGCWRAWAMVPLLFGGMMLAAAFSLGSDHLATGVAFVTMGGCACWCGLLMRKSAVRTFRVTGYMFLLLGAWVLVATPFVVASGDVHWQRWPSSPDDGALSL